MTPEQRNAAVIAYCEKMIRDMQLQLEHESEKRRKEMFNRNICFAEHILKLAKG